VQGQRVKLQECLTVNLALLRSRRDPVLTEHRVTTAEVVLREEAVDIVEEEPQEGVAASAAEVAPEVVVVAEDGNL
jgi:hypothetical protein